MKTTTYTCDRCSATASDDVAFLRRVAVGMAETGFGVLSKTITLQSQRPIELSQYWCKRCCEKVGFRYMPEEDRKTDTSPPTLEDLIIEIIEQVVDEKIEERD